MKQLILSVLINLLVVSASHATDSLLISNPWIPETPPGARVMAGFMEVYNPGDENLDIISVSSPEFSQVEMHLSKDIDGIAKMLPQEKLSIPAKSRLVLKAGSYHLMLIKPTKRLLDGDSAQLNFSLSNGETIKLKTPVKRKARSKHKVMKCAAGKCGGGN